MKSFCSKRFMVMKGIAQIYSSAKCYTLYFVAIDCTVVTRTKAE